MGNNNIQQIADTFATNTEIVNPPKEKVDTKRKAEERVHHKPTRPNYFVTATHPVLNDDGYYPTGRRGRASGYELNKTC